MDKLLSVDYSGGEFQFFGLPHLGVLIFFIFLIAILIRNGKEVPKHYRLFIRYALASILFANELFWHLWHVYSQQWSAQTMLPLHCCSLAIILCIITLIYKNQRIYEFIYLIGIASAIQAIMTPDIGVYGFPHILFFQFFISHCLIIVTAVYMSVVEGYRPYPKSFYRIIGPGLLLIMVATAVNFLIGSNYLFIARKPETLSLLDSFPEWPWYSPIMVLGIVFMGFIIYLPYLWKDWRR